MAKPTTEKIGGELGDVRAAIDVEKLNAYLEAHVLEVTAPVAVKQFKVCVSRSSLIPNHRLMAVSDSVRTGTTGHSALLQAPDVGLFSRIRRIS